MKNLKYFFSLYLIIVYSNCFSQNDTSEYYKNNYFRYENYVYKNNIKTVQLHQESIELSPPIVDLNSSDKLQLSFDDLDGDLKNYSYTVIHCDANWQPSPLQVSEYIDGFTDDLIRNYSYSINTIQK